MADGLSALPRLPLLLLLSLLMQEAFGRVSDTAPEIAMLLAAVFWPRATRLLRKGFEKMDILRHAASD